MATSFLNTAAKRVTNVRDYLRDQATRGSIKYQPMSGETHLVFVPYKEVTKVAADGTTATERQLIAIDGSVHDWRSPDNKYHSTVCLKGAFRKLDDGTVLNDGECPFCDRVHDAWDICNMRKEEEEISCTLTGDARTTHMEGAVRSFKDERKAKEAKPFAYILIAKFRTDTQNKPIVEDGLPGYDLKVIKMSTSRLDKLQQQINNAGDELVGSEILFIYPKTDDPRLVVGQSTSQLVFPNNRITVKYPDVLAKIQEDAAKFEFDGLGKQGFPEWDGMTTEAANKLVAERFESWDNYKKELLVNPNAKYLEYILTTPVANPSLNGAPSLPNVPNVVIPSIAAPTMPTMPTMPNIPSIPTTPATPEAPAEPDVNSLFAGVAGPAGIQI